MSKPKKGLYTTLTVMRGGKVRKVEVLRGDIYRAQGLGCSSAGQNAARKRIQAAVKAAHKKR